MKNQFCSLFLCLFIFKGPDINPDAILGEWETLSNDLIVKVYSRGNEYRAKIIWFDADNEQSMQERLDVNNPNKNMRARRILDIEVLTHLIFNPENNHWEKGRIYDCKSGKEWDSSAWIAKDNLLYVKGFWHFEILGRGLVFKKTHS